MRVIIVRQHKSCMLMDVVESVDHPFVPLGFRMLFKSSLEILYVSDIVHYRRLIQVHRSGKHLIVAPEEEILRDIRIGCGGLDLVYQVRVLQVLHRISHLYDIAVAHPWKFCSRVYMYGAQIRCIPFKGTQSDAQLKIVCGGLCGKRDNNICHKRLLFFF